MITIHAFFFLAQAMLVPSSLPSPVPSPSHAHSEHSRRLTAPSPAPSPEVRITIVNATSVPAISLAASGVNLAASYPQFPQGEWTANEALKTSEIHYLIRSMKGAIIADRTINYKPLSSQFLLLTGDLSTLGPADKPPQLGLPFFQGVQAWPPNLQFHLYPYTLACADPCHYRIVNGMPGKSLLLRSVATGNKPMQQLAFLTPGGSVLLVKQPSCIEWEAEIEGRIYPVSIRQEGAPGNCLIPFFLRDGKPEFIRVFEDP